MYTLFTIISRLALTVAIIIAAFIIGYVLWVLVGVSTQSSFHIPLKMKDISMFCFWMVAGFVIWFVAEAIALSFKKEDNNG